LRRANDEFRRNSHSAFDGGPVATFTDDSRDIGIEANSVGDSNGL
jgi:hypothetical protein